MLVHFSTKKPDQQAINNSVCYVCRPFGRNQEPCPTRTRQDVVCFSGRKIPEHRATQSIIRITAFRPPKKIITPDS